MSSILQNLVIDDLRSFRVPPDGSLSYARTSLEGIEDLEANRAHGVKNLWLDHDLGLFPDGSDDTIMKVVDFLCFNAYEGTPYPVGTIYIHTSNPVGRQNIRTSLDRWGYRNIVIPDASQLFVVSYDDSEVAG